MAIFNKYVKLPEGIVWYPVWESPRAPCRYIPLDSHVFRDTHTNYIVFLTTVATEVSTFKTSFFCWLPQTHPRDGFETSVVPAFAMFSSFSPHETYHIPFAPWCWNMYPQNWAISEVNVGIHIPAPLFALRILKHAQNRNSMFPCFTTIQKNPNFHWLSSSYMVHDV